jgi:hypothetical protein
MTKPTVTVVQDHTKELKQRIKRLSLLKLYVGVPDTKAARTTDAATPGMKAYKGKAAASALPADTMNNATIAYIQNKGSPRANIPARPFMTMGIQDGKERAVKMLKQVAESVLSGDADTVQKGYMAIGLMLVSKIRSRMTDGPWPPLKPRTIKDRANRRKSGVAGTKPLIDTGKLRQAITYVIRTK